MAFVSAKTEIVKAALADTGPYAIGPELHCRSTYISVTAYLPKSYDSVIGSGPTIDEAIEAFKLDLAAKQHTPTKLRAEAAAKLAEADALEATHKNHGVMEVAL